METHDYTRRYWGHDYVFTPSDGGLKARMSGWGRGIQRGDMLILENGSDTSRYRVKTIMYHADPPDMWHAEVEFAPRTEEQRQADHKPPGPFTRWLLERTGGVSRGTI